MAQAGVALTGGSSSVLWPCPGVAQQQLIAVLLELCHMAAEQKRQLGPPEDMALTTGEFAKPNEPAGALDCSYCTHFSAAIFFPVVSSRVKVLCPTCRGVEGLYLGLHHFCSAPWLPLLGNSSWGGDAVSSPVVGVMQLPYW